MFDCQFNYNGNSVHEYFFLSMQCLYLLVFVSLNSAMAAEAEAAREARAKVIAAEGEQKASRYAR
jgi:hypothetical protein